MSRQADKHKPKKPNRRNKMPKDKEAKCKSEPEGQVQQKTNFMTVFAVVGVGFVIVAVILLLQRSGDAGTGSQSDLQSGEEKPHQEATELETVLQKLQPHVSEQCFKSAELVVKDYVSKIHNLDHLLDFFNLLRTSIENDKVAVKVFLVVTGETFGAHEVLLEQVNKSKRLMVETTTDLQGCDIIIVFCPINSRLQSDVEAAMKNITADKPVILVAMHHTRKPEHSTGRTTVSKKFPNVVLDVQVLFHETENGLLTCPRNDQAVSQIQKELEEVSKHSDSSR